MSITADDSLFAGSERQASPRETHVTCSSVLFTNGDVYNNLAYKITYPAANIELVPTDQPLPLDGRRRCSVSR